MDKNNPLVTVIVPIYQVEQYLKRCLDSIVNQTYRNLEIILVDDGSPDNCGIICDEYASKDKRIKVIHKENGGLSSARNAGLEQCCNEGYLMFVDSDDWLSLDATEILVRNMESSNSDIIIFNYYAVYNNREEFMNVTQDCQYSTEEIKHKLICDYWANSVWNKIYKTKVYYEIRFPEGLTFEDAFVMSKVLNNANKITCLKEGLYFYNKSNLGSICKNIKAKDLYAIALGWNEKVKNLIKSKDVSFCVRKCNQFAREAAYLNCLDSTLIKNEKLELFRLINNDIDTTYKNKFFAYLVKSKYLIKKTLSNNPKIFNIWSYMKVRFK